MFPYNFLCLISISLKKAMSDLYSLVKANSVLKNLPVYDMTAACYAPSSDDLDCNSLAVFSTISPSPPLSFVKENHLVLFQGRADYGNQHIYTNNGEQMISLGGSDNK